MGFVSGTNGSKSLYKEMLKHPFSLLLSIFPIFFNFKKIKKIINILNHISSKKRLEFPSPELLTICVNRKFQRQGIANALYKKLKYYFRQQNINAFSIVVGKSLDSNKFYLNQGAFISGSIQVHPGIDSNIFIQEV
jgi:superfamily I DNA/RNA helicase